MPEPKPSRTRIRILKAGIMLVVLTPIAFVGHWYWTQTRAYEESDSVEVVWMENGCPLWASVIVVGRTGQPIKGARVALLSSSGWTLPEAYTDSTGYGRVTSGESEVEAIRLNDVIIVSRPRAYWLGTPSVERGLIIFIRVKDERPFKIDAPLGVHELPPLN